MGEYGNLKEGKGMVFLYSAKHCVLWNHHYSEDKKWSNSKFENYLENQKAWTVKNMTVFI